MYCMYVCITYIHTLTCVILHLYFLTVYCKHFTAIKCYWKAVFNVGTVFHYADHSTVTLSYI